jgi:hypothetical protein
MVMFVQACSVVVVSQEQYEPKCKVNCKTTKVLASSCFTEGYSKVPVLNEVLLSEDV